MRPLESPSCVMAETTGVREILNKVSPALSLAQPEEAL
jgi:hypothetical protein